VKAISQANEYIYQVGLKINSQKFVERVGGVRTVNHVVFWSSVVQTTGMKTSAARLGFSTLAITI
jgi:hypothetical protein